MKVCKDQLLNKSLIIHIHVFNSSYAGQSLGCEIPRSKEHPTNPLMDTFSTYFFTLNEAEITF